MEQQQQQQQPSAGFKSVLLEALGLQPDPDSAVGQEQHDAAGPAAAAAAAATAAAADAAAPAATSAADAHDAAFAARLASISKQFTSDASAARDAQQFLQDAHSQAQRKEAEVLAAADAAYTPAWRRIGLPSKPSQLQLDNAALSGSRLLNPAAIIARQQAHQQKEVLQPPTVFAYCDKSAAPHFLQTTGNQKVRQGIAAARTAAKSQGRPSPKAPQQQQEHAAATAPQQGSGPSSKARGSQSSSPAVAQQGGQQVAATASRKAATTPWSQLPADEAASKVAAATARYKAMAAIMTPEQQQIEEKIITSMYQRLSFLRNPRHAVQQGPGLRAGASGGVAALKGNSTAHRRRAGAAVSSRSCGAAPARYDEHASIRAAEAGFCVVPAQGVLFDEYVPGGVYFQTVQLQNVGMVMKQLRLLPPTSRYFQVSFPRFPLESSALAPGICAEVDVCFTPDSLGDYEDAFSVECPAGRFEVTLTGRRPHPELTLAPVLEVGSVLVGNRRSRTFEFVNRGGAGCFLLMTAQQWAAALQQHEQDSNSSSSPVVTAGAAGSGPSAIDSAVQVAALVHPEDSPAAAAVCSGPFRLYPAYLELPAGAAAVLSVELSPEELGQQAAGYVLVCDNCTASPLRVEGCGEQVQVQLVGLDDREWLPQDAQMPLWLGQVCPGASSSRRLRVANATELPFPFRWTVHGSSSQPGTFTVTPAAGVLQARAEQEFALEFAPPLVGAHSAGLTLSVLRSGDAGLLSITQWAGARTAIVPVDASATGPSCQGLLSAGGSSSTGPHDVTAGQEAGCAGRWSSGSAGLQPCPGDSAWESVVQLGVEGAGLPISLSVLPTAALRVPGVLTVGQQACLPLQLCNDTSAPAHYSITASSTSKSAQGASTAAADVHITPSKGVVPPHSDVQLTVSFTALAAGPHQQEFEVEVLHGPVQQLQAVVEVQQVRVVPEASSLDLGVLCVGASTSCSLQLHNTATDCRSFWCIQQQQQQQQGDQAAAVPPTSLSFEPSHGWLEPLASCSTAVTVTGCCEGAQRLLMCVKSSSTACSSCSTGGQAVAAARREQPGCCSCSAEYVQVLVLLSSPQVSLSKHRLPIQHAYIGVPQHHSMVMTNTSSLPLTFSWTARQQQRQQVLKLQEQLQQQVAANNTVCISTASSLTAAASSGQGEVTEDTAVGRVQLEFSPSSGQLQPGESVRLQLQVEPTAVGPVTMLCCCHVPAMQQLVGFLLTADVGGLQVQYSILHPDAVLSLQPQQQQQQAGRRASSPARRNRAGRPSGRSRVGSPSGHRASSPPPAGGRSHLSSRVASASCLQAGQQQQTVQPSSSGPAASAGQSTGPAGAQVLAADFGQVSLHQLAELLLQVTNLTSICSTVTAWMGEFGAHRSLPACASLGSAGCAGAKSSSSSAWPCETASMQHEALVGDGGASTGAGVCGPLRSPGSRQSGSKSRSSSQLLSSHTWLSCPKSAEQVSAAAVAGKLSRTDPCTYSGRRVDSSASIPAEALLTTLSSIGAVSPQSSTKQGVFGSADSSTLALKGPFRAFAGNAMMAARQAAAAAAAALGPESKGCAVQLLPEACQLPGWGSCLLRLQAFNTLPGSYCDTLYVQVGELPPRQVPVSLQVVGSPLTVSKHRVQRPASDVLHALMLHPAPGLAGGLQEGSSTTSSSGIQDSRAACSLDFGVVTAGLEVQKSFVVSNTGPLPVQLAWDWQEADAPASTAETDNSRRNSASSAISADAPEQQQSMRPSRPESAAAAVLDAETADASKRPPSSASSKKAAAKVLPSGPNDKAAAGLAKSTAPTAASSTAGTVAGGQAGAKQAAAPRARTGSAVATSKKGARGETVSAGEAAAVQQQQEEGVQPQAAPEDGAAAAAGEEAAAGAAGAAAEASTQPPDGLHVAGYDALLPPGGPSSLLQALQQAAPCITDCCSALDSPQGGHSASATSLFSVTPPACVVPPHSQQQFCVSFCSSSPRVVQSLVLRGRQRLCCAADADSQAGRLRLHLLPDPAAAAEGRLLQCRITGGFHPHAEPPPTPMPVLSAALSAVVVAPQLLPSDPDNFCWRVTTTHDPSTHASYLQTATLCNNTECPQVFRLAVQGPFQLVTAVPSVVQDGDALRGMQGSSSLTVSTHAGKKASSQQAPGADSLLLLPPGETVDVSVRFVPALPLRPASGTSRRSSQAHSAAAIPEAVTVEELAGPPSHATEHTGTLIVMYSTGQQQALPLRAAVLQPALLVSPEAGMVDFGSVHAAVPRTLEVVLTNPVDADAAWEAAIQPLQPAAAHTAAATSFSVVPQQGVLAGSGLGMPQQTRLRVTFAPARSGSCAAELHLAVRGGWWVVVSLRGQGVSAEGAERREAYDL